MYWLLGASIAAASLNSVALKSSKVTVAKDVFRFNLIGTIVWCIIIFVVNKGQLHLNREILFWGMVYGIVQMLFILFKALAMSNGDVSVTTVIGNCSLVVSVFASFLLWKEPVSGMDIAGLFILLAAIVLCTYRAGETKRHYHKYWKYYVIIFFILAASVGLVFKGFGKTENAVHSNDMIFVAAVVMMIGYAAACAFTGGIRLGKEHTQGHFLKYAVACGALSCMYNSMNIVLAGKMDAIIFFPAFNGGVMLLSAILGIFICGEKLNWKQKCGILLGITAILLIGIF